MLLSTSISAMLRHYECEEIIEMLSEAGFDAIENQYQTECGVKSQNVTSRAEELIRYVDTLNSKWIVACLDIGHACLVREDPATFIRKLGPLRLKALHIHDVDGVEDLHTLPFYGISNWDRIMQAIKEIGYTGDFTLETPGFLKNLPKELIPAAVNYMAAVGRYLIGKTE